MNLTIFSPYEKEMKRTYRLQLCYPIFHRNTEISSPGEETEWRFAYIDNCLFIFDFGNCSATIRKLNIRIWGSLSNEYSTSFITQKQQWKPTMSFTEGILRILNHRKGEKNTWRSVSGASN